MELINKKNQHIPSFKFASKQGVKCQGGGGARYGINNSNLSQSANSGMGRGYPMSTTSNTCGGKTNPSNLGAATIRGGGKPYSSFNNLRSSAYGYTSAGASMANKFRGSYAPPSEIRRAQCGGRRRTKRRRKSKRKKSTRRKSRRRSRKSRRKKRRKSRRRKSRRRKSHRRKSRGRRTKRRKRQRGGNKWSQAGSNKALGYRYSSPNFNEPMPWALGGPGSKVVTPLTR